MGQTTVEPKPVFSLAAPEWESANLHFLRTTAVLLVFTFHVLAFFGLTHAGGPVQQFGQWGVLLFFVHTSLVLMLSLERQAAQNHRRPYWVFIARRCFRLFPTQLGGCGVREFASPRRS